MNNEIKATMELPEAWRKLQEETRAIVEKINKDLGLSSPKLIYSSFAGAHSLAIAGFKSPFAGFMQAAIEVNEQEERKAMEERRGSLDEQAWKDARDKIMEERTGYTVGQRTEDFWGREISIGYASTPTEQMNTFIVILPNGDRREVKAAYMEVDGGSLYFEDDNRETILAFAPGHWVWAERVEEEEAEEE